MDDAPVRALAADLRDVERYQALRAALAVLLEEMRANSEKAWRAGYWADRIAALLEESS